MLIQWEWEYEYKCGYGVWNCAGFYSEIRKRGLGGFFPLNVNAA